MYGPAGDVIRAAEIEIVPEKQTVIVGHYVTFISLELQLLIGNANIFMSRKA